MATPKSFSTLKPYTAVNGSKGILMSLKLSGLTGSVTATDRTRKVDGKEVAYKAYSVLGTVTGANGESRRITASLGHLISGNYCTVVLKDAEGNTITQADLEGKELTPVLRNGAPIAEGLNTVVGVTAEVVMLSEEPQDVVLLNTNNGPGFYTVVVSAERATEDDFASLMAEMEAANASNVLAEQAG